MKTNVALPLILVVLLGIAGVYVLQTQRQATVPARHAASRGLLAEQTEPQTTKESRKASRRLSLTYYVAHETETDLTLVPRYVTVDGDGTVTTWRQAHEALSALRSFPEKDGDLTNPLPHGTIIIGVVVDQGLATVNLNTSFRDNFNGGAREEQVTIYSIVNTLCDIPEIKAVQFEISGQPISEFAGHLDLSDPLAPDMSIVEPAR
ncbi:MAG: GerMN domain-containing protein [Armatimonadetes bacterium]|jgi:spore germination protein GerM|nr:GerMN domain-containing protein [Armatimonadota bacterium]HOC31001.1 GerMN domain-containing protein [Armatimonadota bacterium]